MASSLKALIWELWVRNRLGMGLVLVSPIAAALLYPLIGSWLSDWSDFRPVGYLPMAAAVLFLAFACAHGELDSHFMGSGFPTRSFNLPVPTWRLVLAPMMLGMILLPLCYGIWVVLVMAPAGYDLPLFWPMVAIMTSNLWLQAVGWTCGRNHGWGILTLSLAISLVVFSIGAASGVLEGPSLWQSRAFGGILLLLLMLFPITFSFFSVKRSRMGEPLLDGTNPLERFFQFPPPPLLKPFANGKRAQLWFDFRLFGYLVPLFFTLVIGLFLSIILLGEISEKALTVMPVLLLFMFLAVVPMAGLEFAKNHFGSKEVEMSLFMAVRPLSDAALAHARLKMLFRSILLSLVILISGQLLMLLATGKMTDAVAIYHAMADRKGLAFVWCMITLSPIFLLLTTWTTTSITASLGLIGNKKALVVLSVMMSLGTMITFLFGVFRLESQENLEQIIPLLPSIFGWVCGLLLVLDLVVYAWSKKIGVLASGALKKVGGPLILFLGLCVAGVYAADTGSGLRLGFAFYCLGLFAGVNLALMGAPLAVYYNRHR